MLLFVVCLFVSVCCCVWCVLVFLFGMNLFPLHILTPVLTRSHSCSHSCSSHSWLGSVISSCAGGIGHVYSLLHPHLLRCSVSAVHTLSAHSTEAHCIPATRNQWLKPAVDTTAEKLPLILKGHRHSVPRLCCSHAEWLHCSLSSHSVITELCARLLYHNSRTWNSWRARHCHDCFSCCYGIQATPTHHTAKAKAPRGVPWHIYLYMYTCSSPKNLKRVDENLV